MPEDPNVQVAEKPVEGVDFDGDHYDQTSGLSPVERDTWLRTGELPKPKEEEPATPAPAEGKPAGETPKPAAESQSADQGEDRSPASFKRMRRQMNNWRDENVRLKARVAELESQPKLAAPAEAPKAEAAPASQSKSLTETLDKIEKDFADGKLTYEQRMEARYDAKLEDRLAKSAQESQQRAAIQKIGAKFQESAKAARDKYPDYDQVVNVVGGVGDKAVVPIGHIIEVRIMRSPVGAEVAYHLGKNKAELDSILALKDEFGQPDIIAQSDAIAALEQKFTAPKPASSPEPKKTRAPEPPVVLGGGNGTVLNEVDRAAREGRNRDYIEARNREALARAKAGRS